MNKQIFERKMKNIVRDNNGDMARMRAALERLEESYNKALGLDRDGNGDIVCMRYALENLKQSYNKALGLKIEPAPRYLAESDLQTSEYATYRSWARFLNYLAADLEEAHKTGHAIHRTRRDNCRR